MNEIEAKLEGWRRGLPENLDVAALYARNPVAHKWKATYRSLLLRQLVSWRCWELLSQSALLFRHDEILGARILLRSAIETLAMLIFTNQQMRAVVNGTVNFHSFSDKTTRLVLGSKNKFTPHSSINIISILEKCDRRYPKLLAYYGSLSETAHPNYDGMLLGYSSPNTDDKFTEDFSSKWHQIYSSVHLDQIDTCIDIYLFEHDEEFVSAFEELEKWIEVNDEELKKNIRKVM